jgi:hypothetical protein
MGTGEPVSRRVRRPVRGVASERVEPERWCVELELNHRGAEDEERLRVTAAA